jgi:AraC-like DNA-binding protein
VHDVYVSPLAGEIARGVRGLWHCTEVDALDETVLPTSAGMLVVVVDPLHGTPATLRLRRPGDRAAAVWGVAGRRTVGVVLAPGGWRMVDRLACRVRAAGRTRSVVRPDWRDPSVILPWMQSVLGNLLTADRPPSAMLQQAEAQLRAGARVGDICVAVGMDRRRLADAFAAVYGIGLKRYARLCRFEVAVAMLRRPDASSLAAVAVEAGYADQAHLSRDVKALAGISPGQLHRRPGPSAAHVLHDETFKTARRARAAMGS